MKKMLIVDGNSILNRAFYGVRPLSTRAGLPTQAVYGMITILLTHLTALHPDYAAVAFDVHAPTFRHKAYDGYKSTRKPMPEELKVQLPYAKQAMAALGLSVVECEGYEADDLLGTLSRRFEAVGDAYLLTGDRDALQLVSDHTTVLLAGNKETVPFTPAVFAQHYAGLSPHQLIDLKAIMGDASDHIPGVPGIGEKGALSLLCTYTSLDNLYQHLDAPDLKPALREKLRAGESSARLSYFLATIHREVPLPNDLEAFAYTGFAMEKLDALCRELEFSKLYARLSELAKTLFPASQSDAAKPESTQPASDLPAADTLHETSVPVLSLSAAEFAQKTALPCALDFTEADETYTFTAFDGKTQYVATAPLAAFTPCLCDETHTFYCHDSKPLHRALYTLCGKTFAACKFDLTLAAYLLHSDDPDFSLAHLQEVYLPDSPILPPLLAIFALQGALEQALTETDTLSLYRTAELPLAAVLAKMESHGFAVDTAGLKEFAVLLANQAEEYAQTVYAYAGEEFNLNSPKQLGVMLFDKLHLPGAKKTKTGYSTGAEILEKLRLSYPIVDAILQYRQVTKLRSTYALGLLKVADPNGRVHSTFHQTVTATGRLSSSDPNLQNIPIRTPLGRQMRKFFIPKPGYVLVDADYSQIELRLLAAISGDENMSQAFAQGLDIHTTTAAQVFGVAPEAVSFEMRKYAKAINFGLIYGMSDFSLAQDLGISRSQAKAYMESYFNTYPAVRICMDKILQQAREKGYTETIFHRRRYIPEINVKNVMRRQAAERIARNSPLQGSAADLMKLAMIAVDKRLEQAQLDAAIVLQIHDELVLEVRQEQAQKAAEILRTEMEAVIAPPPYLCAEATIGKNLLEAK